MRRRRLPSLYREWHYIGHVSTLTTPGDYVTMQLADENIFVIRDDDDQLRGFYNVCRHRAHQLVSGNGRVKDIVCPYHAWRYNKSGELCFARNTQGISKMDRHGSTEIPSVSPKITPAA